MKKVRDKYSFIKEKKMANEVFLENENEHILYLMTILYIKHVYDNLSILSFQTK
jgi:hypothetical protein